MARKSCQPAVLRIVIDTREQNPFGFSGDPYRNTVVETRALETGDYSISGLERHVAVERKSLQDLVGCLGKGRDRFKRELVRARALDAFCVIVEGPLVEIAEGRYRGELNPHSACQSISSFTANLGIPFMFAGTRNLAEYMTWSFLHQYLLGCQKKLAQVFDLPVTVAESLPYDPKTLATDGGKLN